MRRKIIVFLLSFLMMGILLTGIWIVFSREIEAYKRQNTEKELANVYVDALANDTEKVANQDREIQDMESYFEFESELDKLQDQTVNDQESHIQNRSENSAGRSTENSSENRTDNDTIYTPDYARGDMDCVLEIPERDIYRGVYTGTWEEIEHDLEHWMVVTARPDYELGKTHYVIYGHNHTIWNLSFNRLKEVSVGDTFALTGRRGVFTYRVTGCYAKERQDTRQEITDNFSIESSKCFIVTCARGENQGKDWIVEGTLISHQEIQAQ